MSTFKIKVANFFARESCAAWQPKRIIRIIYRHIYRFIMETGAEEYPYANLDFAKWQESDSNFYTLITDSSNFVIRRSTSYVAWMMKNTAVVHQNYLNQGRANPESIASMPNTGVKSSNTMVGKKFQKPTGRHTKIY